MKEKEKDQEPEEEKKIRHTISAEETFTLAKDVFDMRTFIKNVYSNRAVIARRINIITLCVSIIYTLFYVSYTLFKTFSRQISAVQETVVYTFLGVYAATLIALIIIMAMGSRTTTRSLKKFSVSLSVTRLIIKILSIAMAITAIAISTGGSAHAVAFDITVIVFSIISLIVLSIPLFFGGIGRFVRWLLSPVKVKYRFSTVAMEWYKLAITGKPTKGASTKVAKKHYEAIGNLIDGTLVPALGKKYINTIKAATLLNLVEDCSEEDRPVLEGVLKSVFAYATECGYVVFNPCRDLNFEGTVEEKKRKTIKERFAGLGVKIGKKVLNKYIASSTEDEED